MSTPQSDENASSLEQRIAVRAYERWIRRGCPRSDGIEDWFAARAEIARDDARNRKAHDLEIAMYT